MATERGFRIPSQTQDKQPGKEYITHALPQSINHHYKPSDKLHGKAALVIWGDSGIGRSVSYFFTLEGATVAFTCVKGQEDRDKDDTLKMLQEIKAARAKDAITIPTDVGFEENCKEVVDQVISEYGQIDILVNNAAIKFYSTTIEDLTEARLEHALKHMKEGSFIINTTSLAAYAGSPELVDYSSTNGAIVAFTRSLALQLTDRNSCDCSGTWSYLDTVATGIFSC